MFDYNKDMFIASEDYEDAGLSLDKRLIEHPSATFIMKAAGSSPDTDIRDGDLLVVDRARRPAPGRVVIAVARGEMLARRLPPGWREDDGLEVWGVVAWIVRAP